ncbi:MAG: hypothetical protein ACOVP4_10370 [Bacteriovoracaceae bacterium]
MKLMTSLFALIICASAFAQEKVYLDSKDVTINDSQAVLVRTNKTPNKVKLTFTVPMSDSVCTQYDTRYVIRTSGAYCGYATTFRIINERICTRRNPRNNSCIRFETRTRRVAYRFARSCPVPETYCSRYGSVTTSESDKVTIKFKNLPALADSEEETFVVSAKQKRYGSSNVVYDVTAEETVQPYVVKNRGFLGIDKFVIQVK